MTRNPEVTALVDGLVGLWKGEGTGGYPTIDPFEYTEETVITSRTDHPTLSFEQRTWKRSEFGDIASHWEVGLIRLSSDGTAMFNNAQGGRAESMTGSWRQVNGGWAIDLRSTGFAGDDRVLDSTRVIELDGNTLSYVHAMKTRATNEMVMHLRARLTRSSDTR